MNSIPREVVPMAGQRRYCIIGAGHVGNGVARAFIDLTASLLAWAAADLTEGTLPGTGALGTVEAFGIDRLLEGCTAAGLERLP
ncbi:hypothetical protein [Nocardia nepalensis]|uniref:hypothetical protein n=1 Tax=Nocardia nepalensis TaxID=3375448 RepID=UPI003B680E8B